LTESGTKFLLHPVCGFDINVALKISQRFYRHKTVIFMTERHFYHLFLTYFHEESFKQIWQCGEKEKTIQNDLTIKLNNIKKLNTKHP